MDISTMLPGLFGGQYNFGTQGGQMQNMFQKQMQNRVGQMQGHNFQNAYGQGNPMNGAMPNLIEYSSVPMPSGLLADNGMAPPSYFPTMQGMPDLGKSMNPQNLMQMAQLAGTFDREPRQMAPAGGIHRMNQMAPYQFGMSRMMKR